MAGSAFLAVVLIPHPQWEVEMGPVQAPKNYKDEDKKAEYIAQATAERENKRVWRPCAQLVKDWVLFSGKSYKKVIGGESGLTLMGALFQHEEAITVIYGFNIKLKLRSAIFETLEARKALPKKFIGLENPAVVDILAPIYGGMTDQVNRQFMLERCFGITQSPESMTIEQQIECMDKIRTALTLE